MNFYMFLKNPKTYNRLYPLHFQVKHHLQNGTPYVLGKYVLFFIHHFLCHALVTKFIPQN